MYRLYHSGYINSVFIYLRPDKTSQVYFISHVVESDILQRVSKRMTRFQIIISINENVLQLQNKLPTIK